MDVLETDGSESTDGDKRETDGVSDRGVRVSHAAAVTDGAGSGRAEDVLGVIAGARGQRAEHAGLNYSHHRAAAVLHGSHLQHLDDLRLCFLPLGQRLVRLLHLLVQITVHLAHLV